MITFIMCTKIQSLVSHCLVGKTKLTVISVTLISLKLAERKPQWLHQTHISGLPVYSLASPIPSALMANMASVSGKHGES
jgi:hypothetical protein